MHAGVDEAGRGPVLGPLVVAGVHGAPGSVPEEATDSKALTPARRMDLYEAIRAAPGLTLQTCIIPATRIDAGARAGTSLNELELDAFAQVLKRLGAKRAVVDAIGRDVTTGARRLEARLASTCRVEMRTRAETSDPLVAAASIVAKITRDKAIAELTDKLGEPIGSGYPSDPSTTAFLERWRARRGDPPPGLRTSWATAKRLGFSQTPSSQRPLTAFHDTTGGTP